MNRYIIFAILTFITSQTLIWYQTNGQFINKWAANNTWAIALLGYPISYFLIWATKFSYIGFDNQLWPGRLIGFASGMMVFAALTYFHMGESITPKTIVTLVLAAVIVGMQLFWK